MQSDVCFNDKAILGEVGASISGQIFEMRIETADERFSKLKQEGRMKKIILFLLIAGFTEGGYANVIYTGNTNISASISSNNFALTGANGGAGNAGGNGSNGSGGGAARNGGYYAPSFGSYGNGGAGGAGGAGGTIAAGGASSYGGWGNGGNGGAGGKGYGGGGGGAGGLRGVYHEEYDNGSGSGGTPAYTEYYIGAGGIGAGGGTGGGSGGAGGVGALGGVYIMSGATIQFDDNVSFTGNKVKGGSGGAAGAAGATVGTGGSGAAKGSIGTAGGNASSAGGVIAAANNSLISFVKAINFNTNTAVDGYGGAIAISGVTMNFQGTGTFTSNRAVSGGAIALYDSNIIFDNEIQFNTNISLGGASGSKVGWGSGGIGGAGGKGGAGGTGVIGGNASGSGGAGGAGYAGGAQQANGAGSTYSSGGAAATGGSAGSAGGTGGTGLPGTNTTAVSISSMGGALFATGNSNITVNKSIVFDRNTAYLYGGALYLQDSTFASNALTAGQIKFSLNAITATNGAGAAIYAKAANITISGEDTTTIFSENKSYYSPVIYAYGLTKVNLSNGNFEFTKNSATGSNGVISFNSPSGAPEFNITNAKSLKIQGNIANNGGFLYANNVNANIEASDISISANSAKTGAGGAFYIDTTKTVNINAAGIIENNVAYTSGGAAYIKNGNLTITANKNDALTFANNKANNISNDFYLDTSATLTFDAKKPINVKSGISGIAGSNIVKAGTGTLTIEGTINYNGRVDIKEGVLLNNVGANVYANIAELVIGGFGDAAKYSMKNSVLNGLRSNIVRLKGGTLEVDVDFVNKNADFFNISSLLEITAGSVLAVNAVSAGTAGDKVLILKSNGAITYTNGYLKPSDPARYSLSYEASSKSIYIVKNPIRQWNEFAFAYQANENEGEIMPLMQSVAASIEVTPANLGESKSRRYTIDGNNYFLNSIGYEGLGFKTDNQTIAIENIDLMNFAGTNGGALSINNNSTLDNAGSRRTLKFIGNIATSKGGAIYMKDSGIYQRGNSSKLEFNNNTANQGGAIYIENGEFDASGADANIIFAQNEANSGAAIYAENANITISGEDTNTIFSENKSYYSPVIYAYGLAKINLSDGNFEFIKNTAAGGNGIISFNSLNAMSEFNITGAQSLKIQGNIANNGGFLYANNANADIEASNISISANSAKTGAGGVFYINGKSVNISAAGAIENNTAYTNGGAAYIRNGNLTITTDKNDALTFSNNKANNMSNDFYLDTAAILTFDAKKPINVKSGISGVAASNIVKQGTGTLTIEGIVNYNGRLDIKEGALFNNTGMNSYINIAELVIGGFGDAAKYSMKNNILNGIRSDIVRLREGTLEIDVDFANKTADLFDISSLLEITAGSTLTINAISMGAVGDEILILKSNGNMIYTNDNLKLSDPAHYSLSYDPTSKSIYIVKNPVGAWNDFSFVYKENENETISLIQDISASMETVPAYLGASMSKNYIINGNNYSLNSQGYKNLGFKADNQIIAMENIRLMNFTDTNGGAIEMKNDSKMDNLGSRKTLTFMENTALNSGGAIYAKDSDIYQKGSYSKLIFENNMANQGGAVYIENGEFNAMGANTSLVFKENKANVGAAIYAQNANLSFANGIVEFISNVSMNGNGVIELDNSNLSFENLKSLKALDNKSRSGGFLYLNNKDMDMQALNITFNENSAQNGNGGALDIENAVMKITGAMSVQDNYAMQNGGAIYVRNGVIEINSIGNGVFFVNNFMNRTESPVSNDIYLDNNSEALLNAKDNKIVLKSGIAGLRNSHITKTGADNLEIGGHIEFYGTLNVIEGQVQLIAPNAKIGQINIEKDAALTAILNNTAIAGDAVINGTYQMQINLSEKQYSMLSISAGIDAMASGKLIIDENTSIFSILSYGILQEKETSYTALYADGGIEGEFASIEHSNPSIKYNLQYTNNEVILNIRQASLVEQELAYNANNLASYFTKAANDYDNESEAFQPLIAKAFDIPENREARQDFFNKLSGNIIANALIDSADNRNAEIVFQRENSDLFTDNNDQSFWIRGNFYHKKIDKDDNSISNFELDEVSALLGTDIIQNRNMLLGIYADITDTKFKEADDKANASGFGFGLYMFAPINNAMEIYLKSAVSFKYQKFDIERNFIIDEDKYAPQSSFDTKSVKAALDLEKIFKFGKIDITPFLGLSAGIAFNDEIKEENSQTALLIKSGSNSRVYLPFGVNFDFRANNIWTLRAKLFAKPILAGEYGQFNAVFNESANKEEMNIRGIKESFTYGIGLSADYHISDAFAFNMNASMANTEYAIGIGITYKVATGRAKKQEYEYEYEAEDEGETETESEVEAVAYNNYSENTTSLVIAKIDSKEEDLEKLLAEREERNKKAVEKITLGAMTFATGKASLTVEAKESVKRQIKKLNSINYSKIIVEGHTDITGNAKFNDKLSQLRAESVCKELISSGISADKLEYTGYGSKIPAADNETPSGRQANRRTEVWVFEEK